VTATGPAAEALGERFDRLLTLPGHATNGLAAAAWASALGECDRDEIQRAAIDAVRALILPGWVAKRAEDLRPQRALAATEAWLADKSDDAKAEAKAAAKACTEARNETYGYDHHVADAARAIAWACAAKNHDDLWDALVAIERELLARIALIGDYQRAPEQRKALVAVVRQRLLPAPVAAPAAPSGPVPYAASGTFKVGQELAHAKFGALVVTAVNGAAIEVKLADGTTKRLAHKPG
jgi:hypothetical protein